MANCFSLGEVSYESLFDLTGIHENDRDKRVARQFDIDKFNAGMKAVRDDYTNIGRPKTRGGLRTSPHALHRNYLIGKGLNCSKLGPAYKHWFCSFDLYNRSNPNDPNGPRRIITVCENDANEDGRYMLSNGGKIIHVLYTNNHYGDGGKTPAFLYVNPPKVKTPKVTTTGA